MSKATPSQDHEATLPHAVASGSEPRLRTLPESLLLLSVAEASQPLGARAAAAALSQAGLDLSESTVTRLLRRLDSRGLTRPVGAKGRLPTEEGRRVAEMIRTSERRTAGFAAASDVRSLDDLVDLLLARRAVESETAAEAATRASDADIDRLETILVAHAVAMSTGRVARRGATEFHRALGESSHNKMLSVLIDAVLGHHHESLEQLLDVVTKSRGTMGASQVEHRNILDAVAAHDPDAAKDAMTIHLDRLLTDVTQFARRGNAGVVEQILSLVQTPQ